MANNLKSGQANPNSKKNQAKKGHNNRTFDKPSNNVTTVLARAGFTREMMETKVSDLLLMTAEEMREFKAASTTSNFDLIVVSVVEAAQRNADTNRLDNLLEKIFGKTVHITGGLKIENTNLNANLPLEDADADLVTRALERALRGNV